MANPQVENGYLKIANDIQEQLMVSHFTEQQRRILDLILRLSYGCQKKEAEIPLQKDFEIVGIGEGHIKPQIDWLITARVIYRDGSTYSFNKDFDQWRVSRAFHYSPEKLTELVSYNLHKTEVKLTEKGSPDLPKREVELTEKGSLPCLDHDAVKTVKDSIKDSINITTTTSAEIFKLYENEIGTLTLVTSEGIKDWIEEHPPDEIIFAIKEAVKAGVRKPNYINAILESRKAEGYPPERRRKQNVGPQANRGNNQGGYQGGKTRILSDKERAIADAQYDREHGFV